MDQIPSVGGPAEDGRTNVEKATWVVTTIIAHTPRIPSSDAIRFLSGVFTLGPRAGVAIACSFLNHLTCLVLTRALSPASPVLRNLWCAGRRRGAPYRCMRKGRRCRPRRLRMCRRGLGAGRGAQVGELRA